MRMENCTTGCSPFSSEAPVDERHDAGDVSKMTRPTVVLMILRSTSCTSACSTAWSSRATVRSRSWPLACRRRIGVSVSTSPASSARMTSVFVAEDAAFALRAGPGFRQVVTAEHDILRRHRDGRAARRRQDVVRGHHQHGRLDLRFRRERDMHGDLVAVEVGVERRADQRMDADRLALDEDRLERLNAPRRWNVDARG